MSGGRCVFIPYGTVSAMEHSFARRLNVLLQLVGL
jgi:hypothetical protein